MSKTIRFVEETLRDGQLSLWATRMDTRTMLGIAGTLDEAGFQRACISSGAAFDTAIRFLREDPWKRLRLVRAAMPKTPIEFLVRGRNLIGWKRYPDDIAALMLRCLKRAGFDWMLIFDGLNDFRNIAFHMACAKREGLKVSTYLCYAESPVHTDEYFVKKALELVELGVDVINFGDPAGLLNAARAQTLMPALLSSIADRADLLISVHTSTGQALECYEEAMRHGARSVSTVALPLANSESLPSTIDIMRSTEKLGFDCGVDRRAVEKIDAYFAYVALRDSKPVGKPVVYDEQAYQEYCGHQIPGGMISNFVNQHREAGTLNLLPTILTEMAQVRAELGHPPMVTPWSQLVGVQATLNVTTGQRYATVPDQLKLYARGSYGQIPAPIDPNVLDRLLAGGPSTPIDPLAFDGEPTLREIRAQNAFASDEELILRIFYDEATLAEARRLTKGINLSAVVDRPVKALVEAAVAAPIESSVNLEVKSNRENLTYGDASHVLEVIRAADGLDRVDLQTPAYSLSVEAT
ncbi:hypothetical protein [Bradyrhizobium canariense]|uniref:Oxaloacetate decarboxylase, alpha subunit/pyruvate carboxylase subunit B n=1 Tax=Bradyrhizobium canariense TaxID=255045 RepID=A0A1H1XP62_9BRAD|nr:hypothetical protein [Bradyrhizobium canariense]SDT11044.1 oxaloacetate decarboxylase, alpha subunit/pyruvate carboxylase subunit B [Bradyrhizobium canariense]